MYLDKYDASKRTKMSRKESLIQSNFSHLATIHELMDLVF